MPDPAASPASGTRLATICGLLLLAITWAVILHRAPAYEREAFQEAEQNLRNLSFAFEEGLSRSIKAVDQALIAVRDQYIRHGLTEDVKELTRILGGADPMIVALGAADDNGDVTFALNLAPGSPPNFIAAPLNLADRPHFQAHIQPGPDQLYIGPPQIGRVTGRWSVYLSRRITLPDGRWGGVMIATIDAAKMGDFYKKIDIGPDGVVTVIGTDDIARVRVTADGGIRFGDNLRGTSVTRTVPNVPIGILRSVSIVDNRERLLAFRKLPDLPLIVTVAAGTGPLLLEARERQAAMYLTGAAITAAILLSIAAVHVRARRDRERRRHNEFLAAVFANMGEGLTVVDRDLRLAAWNGHVAAMIGADPALFRHGTPVRDIILSQAKAGEFGPCDPETEADRRTRAYPTLTTSTSTRTRPDGRRFELRRRKLPDGGYLTVFLDITELKNAEQALLRANARLEQTVAERTAALTASERRLSRAQDVARVGHWVLTGGMLEYSRAAAAILGAAPETLSISPRDHIEQFVHPDDRARVAAVRLGCGTDSALRDNTNPDSAFLEYRIVRPGGAIRVVTETIDVVPQTPGVPGETIGTIHDITERAEAERELAATRANLLDAIESIDHSVVLYDRDDRIALYNRRLLDYNPEIANDVRAGLRYEELLRLMAARGLIGPPPGQTLDAFLAQAAADHLRANGVPYRRVLLDGRIREIWTNRARNGGIIAVGMDITEKVRTEQQLVQAQRMEAVGNLTGGIAHDFNNLLAIILLNQESLARRVKDDPVASALVEESLTAVLSGAGLSQRLLAFARRQNLAPAVVPVNQLIEGVTGLLRRTLGENIAISLELGQDIRPAVIDQAQLEASLINLATNARDAMPRGGRITISTANRRVPDDPAPAGHVPTDLAPGDYVEIRVADTGMGMPADVLGRIFEPFFTTKEPGKGSGLGLSMVFGFLKQSGGQIAVESTPGEGSVFHLFLPGSAVAPPDRPAPALGAPMAARSGETILVVEDNKALRVACVRQLVTLGYRVLEAGDARAGLARLETETVNLVLSDVLMPGEMDGAGLAHAIAARWPEIKVILTSGFADARLSGESGAQPPFVRFLAKPVRHAELARAIREALDG